MPLAEAQRSISLPEPTYADHYYPYSSASGRISMKNERSIYQMAIHLGIDSSGVDATSGIIGSTESLRSRSFPFQEERKPVLPPPRPWLPG